MAEELFFVTGTFKKASLGTKCPRCHAEYCDYPGLNIPISLVECGHVLCFSCIDAIYLRQLRAPPYRCCYSDCSVEFSPYWSNSNKLLAVDAEYELYDGMMVARYVFGDEPNPRSDAPLSPQPHYVLRVDEPSPLSGASLSPPPHYVLRDEPSPLSSAALSPPPRPLSKPNPRKRNPRNPNPRKPSPSPGVPLPRQPQPLRMDHEKPARVRKNNKRRRKNSKKPLAANP